MSTLLVLDRPAPEVRHEVRGKAAPVIELIDTFDVDWRGRSALLICANGGDAARQLCAERGTAGVDVLTLHDLIGDAMSERQFGIVVVGDILYQRTATEVTTAFDWIRDHLCQGGECLVETRTFLAPDGGGLPPAMPTDYAHLVLPREVIEEYRAQRGLPRALSPIQCVGRPTSCYSAAPASRSPR